MAIPRTAQAAHLFGFNCAAVSAVKFQVKTEYHPIVRAFDRSDNLRFFFTRLNSAERAFEFDGFTFSFRRALNSLMIILYRV
jgi:hypothetical protein